MRLILAASFNSKYPNLHISSRPSCPIRLPGCPYSPSIPIKMKKENKKSQITAFRGRSLLLPLLISFFPRVAGESSLSLLQFSAILLLSLSPLFEIRISLTNFYLKFNLRLPLLQLKSSLHFSTSISLFLTRHFHRNPLITFPTVKPSSTS